MKIAPIKFNNIKISPLNKVSFCAVKLKAQPAKDSVCFNAAKTTKANNNQIEKRLEELKQKNIPPNNAINLAALDERSYQKALYLISKNAHPYVAIEKLAQLEDKKFVQALNLIEHSIHASRVYDCVSDDELLAKVNRLRRLGASCDEIEKMLQATDDEWNRVISLVNKKVNFDDAIKIVSNPLIQKDYEKNLESGYNEHLASTIACVGFEILIKEEDKPSLAKLIKIIEKQAKNTSKLSQELIKFFQKQSKNYEFNLDDFLNYIQNIDFKTLKISAPRVKSYSPKEMLAFLKYHFDNSNLSFAPESLGKGKNLTTYLKNNYIDGHKLNEILITHPLLNREVGQIPDSWLENVKDKQKAIKEIYRAIKKFQNDKNTFIFSFELTKILSKKVDVEPISKGAYGLTYKIEIDGLSPACLKIFHTHFDTYNDLFDGAHYEVQAGLFLNNHSNDFVKMYFGKVVGEKNKDGFIVTKFLSDSIEPFEAEIAPNHLLIRHLDNKPQNTINNKIVDYGGVYVEI